MIVQDIYVILVSIVTSESTSNVGGRMVSKHHNKLHLNTLETLMCAQSWLGNEMEVNQFLKYFQYYECFVLNF